MLDILDQGSKIYYCLHPKWAEMNHPLQLLCLVSLLSFNGEVSAFTGCQKSILTVRYVPSCPINEVSWKEAARKMNCESVTQNCASKRHKFQYHCLMNVHMNATIEVCALSRTIFGYCAEFDINAAVVQENYNADCKTHDPSCPEYYDSSEAYKYQSCYALVQRKSQADVIKPAALIGSSSSSNSLLGNKLMLAFKTILLLAFQIKINKQ